MADLAPMRLQLTADILTSFLSHNQVAMGDLPALVRSVYGALGDGDGADPASEAEPVRRPTPVQVKRSVTPGHLFSFIDGKPYKTLTRHLHTNGFTPQSYRAHFGLPPDYPMTSEETSKRRSEFAKTNGLGRGRTS